MTIIEHLEDLEAEDMRLLASVMLAEDQAEEEWDLYFASLARQNGVERETQDRLVELQGELALLLDAGCSAVEAKYLTKLEGSVN